MKTFACAALFIAFTAPQVQADPMVDICRARAEKASGQSGPQPGYSRQASNSHISLSGSVAVGVGHSSGRPTAGAPAFAGQAAIDRREERARQKRRDEKGQSKYTRIYDACMRGR